MSSNLRTRRMTSLAALLPALLLSTGTWAQSVGGPEAEQRDEQAASDAIEQATADSEPTLDRIMVTATRGTRELEKVPRSVTIIDEQDLDIQLDFSSDLSGALEMLVPGIAPSVEGNVNSQGQDQIRGRRLQLVVDGVVMNNDLVDFREEFLTLDPEAIERIEVIRGGTAVYGFGAVGGVISITTKRPSTGGLQARTRGAVGFNPSDAGSSLAWEASQTVANKHGPFDYSLTASHAQFNSKFDGRGDRIPSERSLDENNEIGINAAVGFDISNLQRVELSGNWYRYREDERFLSVGADLAARTPGRAVRAPVGVNDLQTLQFLEQLGQENAPEPAQLTTQVYTGRYRHLDFLGSRVDIDAFFSERDNDATTFLLSGPSGIEVGRNETELERYGVRLTIDSPMPFLEDRGRVLWGVDWERVDFRQPVTFPSIGPISPPIERPGFAQFVQLDADVTDRLNLTFGVRHEKLEPELPDFNVIPGFNLGPGSGFEEQFVEGGKFDLEETLVNGGFTFGILDELRLFGSFSQGFTSAEVLRAVRFTDAPSVNEAADTEAQVVDNWELGFRGSLGPIGYTLAGFFTESDLGTTFGQVIIGGQEISTVERAPEEIWGIEATVNGDWGPSVAYGGTFSWQEGIRDFDEDGDYERLPGNRISPVKLTGFVEYRPNDFYGARAQVLYSGNRNEFNRSLALNEGKVDDYVRVDLSTDVKLFEGRLTVAVRNLLNNFFIPAPLQGKNNQRDFIAAPGRFVNVSYAYDW